MEQTDRTYQKWRTYLFRTNVIFALIVVTMELVFAVMIFSMDFLSFTPWVYLVSFLLVPSACNALILISGWLLMRHLPQDGWFINYVPLLQMVLLATVIACVHYDFSALMSLYCFPVFASVIFDNRHMPRTMTVLGGLLLLAPTAVRMNAMMYDGELFRFPFEAVVALMILVSCNLISSMLIHFQAEKNHLLRSTTRRQMAMREQLERDLQTGLYNRPAFFRQLGEMVNRGNTFSVVMMDIDNFKVINDTYGHLRGDQVLLALAELMLSYCPASCFPARVGGEEFTILVPLNSRDTTFLVNTIRIEFSRKRYPSFREDGGITISCGVAQWEPGLTGQEIYHRADLAMYYSKRTGKNRTTIYTPEVGEAAREDAPQQLPYTS